uniref:RxLR effector protein n=1 Tax=Chromera velia CCMP2878 TaxID=1169474 RepID=A0A0G4I2N7_9ALVE|mmetsp:Transcript_47563/g.93865  ORF Transcript_47563/g.93865 Transcript_47563/m.93865 type:complete len:148 (+) Transcript_47563:117-560(+)|eukprot:Cvel_10416.t1-p1 / transcript=Cvel_10416.t1 / gene=Cvel_10416 / organism=Chromera_velia_CCMP2878 / gene_product=hypothetical protein / transcript_product=hypothetical protein / location=Cvel_scaffold628:6287-6727(+) / protein_length=147 / sequence_SO=supercontig / SO=protein_coding / is_pseudo=false
MRAVLLLVAATLSVVQSIGSSNLGFLLHRVQPPRAATELAGKYKAAKRKKDKLNEYKKIKAMFDIRPGHEGEVRQESSRKMKKTRYLYRKNKIFKEAFWQERDALDDYRDEFDDMYWRDEFKWPMELIKKSLQGDSEGQAAITNFNR